MDRPTLQTHSYSDGDNFHRIAILAQNAKRTRGGTAACPSRKTVWSDHFAHIKGW